MPVLLPYCARLVLVPSFPVVVVLVNMYWAESSLKTKFAHSFVVIAFFFFSLLFKKLVIVVVHQKQSSTFLLIFNVTQVCTKAIKHLEII